MRPSFRTVVTFKSRAFNTSEQKSYFINPGCFGDDLAKWLIGELRLKGLKTDDEPGQEDFGWYLGFQIANQPSIFVIGYRPEGENAEGIWIGWLDRKVGLMKGCWAATNMRSIGRGRDDAHHAFEFATNQRRPLAL